MGNVMRTIRRTLLVGVLVAGGTAAVGAPALARQPDPTPPAGLERMHEQMDQGNPGMTRMHELMMAGNPGMEQMHELMMTGAPAPHR